MTCQWMIKVNMNILDSPNPLSAYASFTCHKASGEIKYITLSSNISPYIPSKDYILAYSLSEIKIYNQSFEDFQTFSSKTEIQTCSLGIIEEDLIIFCGFINGVIGIINACSSQVFFLLGHKRAILFLKQIETNKLLSCSEDFSARIWDVKHKRLITILEGHKAGVLCADFNVLNNIIATGGRDSKAILWAYSQDESPLITKPIQTYLPNFCPIAFIRFHGELIITITNDNLLLIWRPLSDHFGPCIDLLWRIDIINPDCFHFDYEQHVIIFQSQSKQLQTISLLGDKSSELINFQEKILTVNCIYTSNSLAYLIGVEN